MSGGKTSIYPSEVVLCCVVHFVVELNLLSMRAGVLRSSLMLSLGRVVVCGFYFALCE